MTTAQTSYFVAKVANIPSLRKCLASSQWACRDRASPPHPRDILTKALGSGSVVLIFSVNNCHGYHGYAQMLTIPDKYDQNNSIDNSNDDAKRIKSDDPESNLNKICDTKKTEQNFETEERNSYSQVDDDVHSKLDKKHVNSGYQEDWHYFDVEWKISFLQEFGEQCLPFTETENLFIESENIPLNKCRNWQEVPLTIGEKVCKLIESYYLKLCAKREEKIQRQLEKKPKAFYENQTDISTEHTWKKIVNQVETDLGKVILACPFGSQRYNLSTPESDTDMFIVYQAKTRDILGFNPPKQTIKNSEQESCDYTIHEMFRYCELLLSGDARCVETLFLNDSTVVQASDQWKTLKQGRKLLLNRECLKKYLRDAEGSKGTRYLRKWCEDHKEVEILPPKLCKMVYVIIRLLQNARDIANGTDLHVYREEGTEERDILMSIRAGGLSVTRAWEIIDGLEKEITQKAVNVPEKSPELSEFLQTWLLENRHKDFNYNEKNNIS